PHTMETPASPQGVLAALAVAAGIALSYPVIRRASAWAVDTVLLKRPDAAGLKAEIARRLVNCETPEDILKLTADSLGSTLNARHASWDESAETAPPGEDLVQVPDRSARSSV